MCGISGVYGLDASFKATLLTLGQLERGTKGCGVAYTCSSRIKVVKEPVHPIRFFNNQYHRLNSDSMTAIGHNRQPSQGAVNYVNTHPFLSCFNEFALVHNGHMFNHDTEKKLKAKGHKIKGDTDSEVITHLVEDLYHEHGDMAKALYELDEHHFNGAILVLMKSGTIYGMKDHVFPLHLGKTRKDIYLASSENAISGLAGKTLKVFEPKPYQVVEVRKGKIYAYEPKEVKTPIITYNKGRFGKFWDWSNWTY